MLLEYCICISIICPLNHMNKIKYCQQIKCSEKQEERANYSKLIICPIIKYIYILG